MKMMEGKKLKISFFVILKIKNPQNNDPSIYTTYLTRAPFLRALKTSSFMYFSFGIIKGVIL